jgi:tRNA/tmRNA/rRNA uracil-C5-methylase (TrmA/RlmC/RlmD family)
MIQVQVKPECRYFGTCGGCVYQDVAYEDQLSIKEAAVLQALKPFHAQSPFEVLPVLASPKPYYYRRQIALTIKRRQGKLHFGFMGHEKETAQRFFLPIESCSIADERLNLYFEQAMQKLRALPDKKKYRTSQMVLRVGDEEEATTSLRCDAKRILTTTVLGKTFRYAVSSFFQHNHSILETFVKATQSLLHPSGRETLLDLYSGVGLLGISLAEDYRNVLAIEEGYESIQQAAVNARENSVGNIECIEGKVELLVQKWAQNKTDALHVIADPPRAGLKKEVIDALCSIPIKRLVYVSCNLEALQRDLKLLANTFKIVTVQPIDFFPQTKQIETLVLLEKMAGGPFG